MLGGILFTALKQGDLQIDTFEGETLVDRFETRFLTDRFLPFDPEIFDPVVHGLVPVVRNL